MCTSTMPTACFTLTWTRPCHSAESVPYPSRATLLFRSIWPYLPDQLLRLVKYLPTRDHIHFRRTLDKIEGYASSLVQEKTRAVLEESETAPNKRDIISIMGASSPR